MKSLRELTANKLASSERELKLKEAELVLAVIDSMNMQSETSDYDVVNGKLVHITRETKGLVTKEYINGKLVKLTRMYPNGTKQFEKWFKDKKTHREDGPAEIFWYPNGNKEFEVWYRKNKIHREGAPAEIRWRENGQLKSENWWKNNKLHRVDGPASIYWDENGNKTKTWYYYFGRKQ